MNRTNRLIYNIINSLVVALIAFVSSLPFHPPTTLTDIYPALIAFVLTFLIQIRNLLETPPRRNKPNPKQTTITNKAQDDCNESKPLLLSIIV